MLVPHGFSPRKKRNGFNSFWFYSYYGNDVVDAFDIVVEASILFGFIHGYTRGQQRKWFSKMLQFFLVLFKRSMA